MAISAIKPLHQHNEHCGCGHHGVGVDLAKSDWKTRLGVVLAIGARPCSGAIMILMFSNALGIISWGIAAVMTMSLGTALSIMGLSLAVRYARERTVALVWWRHVPELDNADGQNCRRGCSDTVRDGPVPDGDPRRRWRRLHRRRMLIKKTRQRRVFLSLVNSRMLVNQGENVFSGAPRSLRQYLQSSALHYRSAHAGSLSLPEYQTPQALPLSGDDSPSPSW